MNKTELESKHLAELHTLAADAGVERYRMLPRAELIEKLAGGGSGGESKPKGERQGNSGRGQQRDRSRKPREPRQQRKPRQQRPPRDDRKPREGREEPRRESRPEPPAEPQRSEPAPVAPAAAEAAERPKRKRRRRRWGRRAKGVRIHDLLLPAAAGRQAIVYAESRPGCTALLREVAAELSGASDGPDPIAVLVDPTPEELADWKREAPRAEIVSAGKANHVGDAIAQAKSRASGGEDVIVLVDSLSRYAETFAGVEEARELFDAGLAATGSGSLTVVAALERSG